MAIAIQAVAHINVNCSQLERSLGFYQDVVGLKAESHTNPVPQDGAGFGLAGKVQWDAYILHDSRGMAGPGLDLLQWMRPAPTGRLDPEVASLGLARVVVRVPSLGAFREQALAAGGTFRQEAGSLYCVDPDGALIELREDPGRKDHRLEGVILHCSDLARSLEWYRRVIGLGLGDDLRSVEGPSDWVCRVLLPPNREFAIELRESRRPQRLGPPHLAANHLGLYRMAFLVADIRAARRELLAQGVACPEPVWLDMGPEIPIDGLWACFFPDPDGTCLELIETPRLQSVAD